MLFYCNCMENSKEFSRDIRKRIVNTSLVQSWLQFPDPWMCRPSAHIITCNVQPLYYSGREHLLCPRDEFALVQKVQINQRPKAKDLVKILAEAGKSVSLFTKYCTACRHRLKGKSHDSKTNTKLPNYSFQMHKGAETLILGDMPFARIK